MNAPSPAVRRATSFLRPTPSRALGPLDLERLSGRLVEVSEAGCHGALSAACRVVFQVQARGEAVAWVSQVPTIFFPPDLAYRGLDVGAITVVRGLAAPGALQAGEWLVKSGAFGAVVFDWNGPSLDEATLGRLAKLAAEHQTLVLFLTKKPDTAPSLGTQVSLRVAVDPAAGGPTVTVAKDKQAGPPSFRQEALGGPLGLY
jgi:hypothetical protein